MSHLFILVTLATLATCSTTIMRTRQGEGVNLIFQYPCNSQRVTLQYGIRSPSYNSANPELISLPPNQKLEVVNESDVCFLNLTIDPVLRDDAGTYIMTVYNNGQYTEDARIGLRVDYLPGKAFCESSNDYNDDHWASLRCTAPAGTIPGQIICYQNQERVPPFTAYQLRDGSIIQIIIIRLEVEDIIFCCSSTFEHTKSECDCDDFAWNPVQMTALLDEIDPCPSALLLYTKYPMSSNHPQDSTQTHAPDSILLSSANPATADQPCIKIRKVGCPLHWENLLIVAVVLIAININLNALNLFKTWKIEKGLRNLHTGKLDTSDVLQQLKALLSERDIEVAL